MERDMAIMLNVSPKKRGIVEAERSTSVDLKDLVERFIKKSLFDVIRRTISSIKA